MLAHKVRNEVHRIIAELTSWSMEHAGEGIGPDRGFMGEQFPKKPTASTWEGSN